MDTFASKATNSSMLEVCCTSAEAAQSLIVTGNTFQNLNASKQITYGINFDVLPALLQVANNNFAGNIASPSNNQVSATSVHPIGIFTTTAASSDTFSSSSPGALPNIAAVRIGSGCFAQAMNSTAAGMAGSLYIAAVSTQGAIVIHHAKTAGGVFAVFCAMN
jgi:hypothetical protein